MALIHSYTQSDQCQSGIDKHDEGTPNNYSKKPVIGKITPEEHALLNKTISLKLK